MLHNPMRPSPLVAAIVQTWRMRQRWHRAEKSLTLQGKAICRAWASGDKEEASVLFDSDANDPVLAMALSPFRQAISMFEPKRKETEKNLKAMAKDHPLFPWVKAVPGFGPLNLAALIGEAGDIASYRNPSCLWKRMGLAVIDGQRQRKVSDAELAMVHGYNPQRRCVAYLIGEALIKKPNRYRAVYDERKAAKLAAGQTKGHAHNDAMRYMVKRVLRDLWIEANTNEGLRR